MIRPARWRHVPSATRAAHDQHLAVVDGDLVVGNVASFFVDGERTIGCWIGRQYRGRGHATAALAEYVVHERARTTARVAGHNVGGIRVLVKMNRKQVVRNWS